MTRSRTSSRTGIPNTRTDGVTFRRDIARRARGGGGGGSCRNPRSAKRPESLCCSIGAVQCVGGGGGSGGVWGRDLVLGVM
jgi:hypothetical protein